MPEVTRWIRASLLERLVTQPMEFSSIRTDSSGSCPPFEEIYPPFHVGDFVAVGGERVVSRSMLPFPCCLSSKRKLQDSSLDHLPFRFACETISLLSLTADVFSVFHFSPVSLSRFLRFWPLNFDSASFWSENLLSMVFQFLMAWDRVLLIDVLIVRCQDRLELLRSTYPHVGQTFQDVILTHFFFDKRTASHLVSKPSISSHVILRPYAMAILASRASKLGLHHPVLDLDVFRSPIDFANSNSLIQGIVSFA